VIAATTLGYATHGLIDACTTYGTLLLWPFSHLRVSWRLISVIDPLFTLPLLAAVVASVVRKSRRAVIAGWTWAGIYLGLCLVQHVRASHAQHAIAKLRGHEVQRAAVFPSFANNITWRSLYRSGDRYYVDKIRVGWMGKSCVSPGQSVSAAPDLDPTGLLPAVVRGERLIRWFSRGWVAYDPTEPSVLGDLRYSFAPTQVRPIWGIRRDPPGQAAKRVLWVNNNGEREVSRAAFISLVFDDAPDAHCL
jgi:inner membrane protein